MTLRGGVELETEVVLLEGDALAFAAFAELLRSSPPAEIALDALSDASGTRPLRSFEVRSGTGPAVVSLADDCVVLAGATEARERVATEVELFLEHNVIDEPGMHTHVDASDSGEPLAPHSLDILLMGPVPES